MDYVKIDEETIKETKQVETNYDIDTIKREIELLDADIVRADERKIELVSKKAEYEALLAEAIKLGIKEKIEEVDVVSKWFSWRWF